jgi:hypothetical protein
MLLRIEAPHFVAGLETGPGRLVTRPAPIVGYMRGWSVRRVISYCRRKRWRLQHVLRRREE